MLSSEKCQLCFLKKNNAELVIAGMPNLVMNSLWPNLASGFSMKEVTLRSVIDYCVLLAAVCHIQSHKMGYVFHFMFLYVGH